MVLWQVKILIAGGKTSEKSLFMKSISILLVVTLITSTITFCLGGCSVKFKPKMADIDTPTYSDTRLEISSQNVSKNYSELTNALKSNDSEEIKEKADALKKIGQRCFI